MVGKDRRGDGRKRCLLFGFEPEVVAEVADVGGKVVDCKGESADVGCEVVEVPFIQFTRQPVVSLQVSSKKGARRDIHTFPQRTSSQPR